VSELPEKDISNVFNAPINVNPEGGRGGGRARGGDLTFLQKKMSNATPSGENSWAKFPTPGMKLYSLTLKYLVSGALYMSGDREITQIHLAV
jgi:hypothetical protein